MDPTASRDRVDDMMDTAEVELPIKIGLVELVVHNEEALDAS